MKKALVILFLLLTGNHVAHAQNQEELLIEFTEIDSLEYQKFKKEYLSLVTVDSTKKANSFSLLVNNKVEQFDNVNDNNRYYYKGFLAPLNCYVLNHCSKYICRNFLLNQETGERNFLFSPYDNECEIPVLSNDLKLMLVFATDVFDRGSFISIYPLKEGNGKLDFESFKSFTTTQWSIYQAIWINNTSIALMTFDEYGGTSGNEPLNLKYYKGDFK
jgi:ribulose bisphosphate carboxylase small subunit